MAYEDPAQSAIREAEEEMRRGNHKAAHEILDDAYTSAIEEGGDTNALLQAMDQLKPYDS